MQIVYEQRTALMVPALDYSGISLIQTLYTTIVWTA